MRGSDIQESHVCFDDAVGGSSESVIIGCSWRQKRFVMSEVFAGRRSQSALLPFREEAFEISRGHESGNWSCGRVEGLQKV
jgi:hypothetical protein